MARLGELLVAAGLLTSEQVEQALRAQILWGARIGTNLIELGFVDLDALSTALGRQRDLPAALARHFDHADLELQQRLPAPIAEMFSCVPLVRVGPKRDIVIASTSPLSKKALIKIAEELRVQPAQLIPAIAAELRIRYQLEKVYKIHRSSRFKRAPGKTVPPFPEFLIEEAEPESEPDILLTPIAQVEAMPAAIDADGDRTLPFSIPVATPTAAPEPRRKPPALIVDDEPAAAIPVAPASEADSAPIRPPSGRLETLDELAADSGSAIPAAVVEDNSSGRERRTYIRTIADAPTDSERQASLGRIAIRRVAVALDAAPSGIGNTVGEATRAIRRATDRDRVAELCMETLFRFAPSCEAATLLVLRGQVATSWKGFCRSGAPQPEIAVPLDQIGLVPRAAEAKQTVRSPATDLGPIDQLLLVSLGSQTGDLVVVPVSIAGQVMCVVAMVTELGAQSATGESIAAAAGAAFARLMRDASR